MHEKSIQYVNKYTISVAFGTVNQRFRPILFVTVFVTTTHLADTSLAFVGWTTIIRVIRVITGTRRVVTRIGAVKNRNVFLFTRINRFKDKRQFYLESSSEEEDESSDSV